VQQQHVKHVKEKIMKQELIIALLLNLTVLLFSSYVFVTKVIAKEFILWKFLASLSGVIIFGIFVFLILRQLKIH